MQQVVEGLYWLRSQVGRLRGWPNWQAVGVLSLLCSVAGIVGVRSQVGPLRAARLAHCSLVVRVMHCESHGRVVGNQGLIHPGLPHCRHGLEGLFRAGSTSACPLRVGRPVICYTLNPLRATRPSIRPSSPFRATRCGSYACLGKVRSWTTRLMGMALCRQCLQPKRPGISA